MVMAASFSSFFIASASPSHGFPNPNNPAATHFPSSSSSFSSSQWTGRSPCPSPSSSFSVSRKVMAFSSSSSSSSPAAELRRILALPGIQPAPACFDALSARLVQQAGFNFAFTSGFSISAVRLALPDTGLISYGEIVDQGRLITSGVSIPVIGDGDNGYGNALNVKRTIKGYIKAGFGGIILEDQVSPKACGHTQGRKVASREEAIVRIRAAVDARNESGADLVIVARTDARQAVSLEEALWRAQAFADYGADVLFIDALASREEMESFCNIARNVPKMANMLEGGGKSPILSLVQLEDIGYKIVAYPLSLLGVSIRSMQNALAALKSGRLPPPGVLPSFEEIKEVVGFNEYYNEEQRYISISSPPYGRDGSGVVSTPTSPDDSMDTSGKKDSADYIIPYVMEGGGSQENPFSGIWSRTLRVKVTSITGDTKLDFRIPAGFLDGLAKVIPGVAGLNLSVMLDEAAFKLKGNFESGQKVLDFTDTRGDCIQVFLE